MSDAATADDSSDDPVAEFPNRMIRKHSGRVSIPRGEYNPGTVLDVVIEAPRDSVPIMDAEVLDHCGDQVLNIPDKKFKHYDIEEGQQVTVVVDEVNYRA